MATRPVQDGPSVPETEHSKSDSAEELRPFLVLRTAKSLILPLRIPDQWKEQPSPAAAPSRSTEAFPVVAFEATTRVLDPRTQRFHNVRLSVQPGLDDGHSTARLHSDSIPAEGTWRAALYAGTALRASVPFINGHVELDRAMSPGVYTVELANAGTPVSRFALALEPFSLPEALQAGGTYVAHRQYVRAAAVLSAAAERYPENADTQDLLVLAHALATADPAGFLKEQSEFGVVRSASDVATHLREALASTKTKFGKRMASIFAARSLDRAAIPDEVIAKIAQETASIVVTQVMAGLKERLEAREAGDELLLQVLEGVTERFEEVEILRRELTDRIDLLRRDALKSDDERFGAVEEALKRFADELAKRHLRTSDYEAFFAERLGQPCWHWISRDARKIFMESEDHYRHAESRPLGDEPDFTSGLLDLCRGLEMLLNEALGAISVEIARSVLGDTQAFIDVSKGLEGLPERMRNSLRPSLETVLDKTKRRKSLSPSEIAFQLYIGRLAERSLGESAKAVLRRAPGPADVEQLAILHLITSEYRNGKTHPVSGSPHIFTSRDEMRALRKLVFGIDEEKSVRKKEILDGISRTSWLPKHVTGRASDKVSQGWGKFPGIVPVLWMALGGNGRETTAA